MYIISKGTENKFKEKFGFSLKIVFGINSPVNRINNVEIIDWIRTIKASLVTNRAINGSSIIAICRP